MGRGLLDASVLALITDEVPDLTPLYGRVLPLAPDYLSTGFAPDSTIPIAGVSFIDTLHTLADARGALFECYAHAIYYRVVEPSAYMAVWFEQHYSRAVAYDLYTAGNQLASAIADMLEVSRPELAPYRRRRSSEQAIVAAFLRGQRPGHPVTLAVQQLGNSQAYRSALNYRSALVHGQPPLFEGRGIVYRRASRWRSSDAGSPYLTFGGGDRSTDTTENTIDFLRQAIVDMVQAFSSCVDFYLTLLASRDIIVTDGTLRMPLRL